MAMLCLSNKITDFGKKYQCFQKIKDALIKFKTIMLEKNKISSSQLSNYIPGLPFDKV